MEIQKWMEEITKYYRELDVSIDGPHIWDNYQKVVAIMLRVGEIRQELAWSEVQGTHTPESKKFRTMIVDPFIDRLHEVATFESRKITARNIEAQMEK